jgi:hypothetical protein
MTFTLALLICAVGLPLTIRLLMRSNTSDCEDTATAADVDKALEVILWTRALGDRQGQSTEVRLQAAHAVRQLRILKDLLVSAT